jgi:hypothetical protein
MNITDLTHVVFGVITAIVSKINIFFSVLNTFLFVLYELDEEFHLHDESYKDIKEFVIGLTLGELTLLVLELLKLF